MDYADYLAGIRKEENFQIRIIIDVRRNMYG